MLQTVVQTFHKTTVFPFTNQTEIKLRNIDSRPPKKKKRKQIKQENEHIIQSQHSSQIKDNVTRNVSGSAMDTTLSQARKKNVHASYKLMIRGNLGRFRVPFSTRLDSEGDPIIVF